MPAITHTLCAALQSAGKGSSLNVVFGHLSAANQVKNAQTSKGTTSTPTPADSRTSATFHSATGCARTKSIDRLDCSAAQTPIPTKTGAKSAYANNVKLKSCSRSFWSIPRPTTNTLSMIAVSDNSFHLCSCHSFRARLSQRFMEIAFEQNALRALRCADLCDLRDLRGE